MKTDERLDVWTAFLHAHEAVTRAIEAELQRTHGLALTVYEALHQLDADEHGSLRMQDLADRAMLSKSGLTRLVDRMAAEGWVERAGCSTDRRVTYTRITDEGRALLERCRGDVVEAIRVHFASLLTEPEAEVLREVFRKILQAHARSSGLDACGWC